MKHRPSTFAAAASIAILSLLGWPASSAPGVGAADMQGATEQRTDPEWRPGLIGFAFDAASAVPTEVHGRERARLQESAGLAALAAGDPVLAKNLARRIDGWRRGTLLSEIALTEARDGDADKARELVRQALDVAPAQLDWQRERIQVLCGRALAWIGDDAEASRLEKGVGEAEVGKVAAARAARFPEAAFDAQMAQLDGWIVTRNFDLVRNASEVCLEFYPHCFADPARRTRVEAALSAAIEQLAYDIRIDLLVRMAAIAHSKGDSAAAAGFVDKADAVRAASPWSPEDGVAHLARIASVRARMGDKDAAVAGIASALALFASEREHIADIHRAASLRSVAEAQVAAGDPVAARATLARAVAEGAVNPNARPRAADLVLNALVMVRLGLEPDAASMASLQKLRDGLVAPW